ncbi:TIGR04282 family arsenosugar biosynthesis glycosyltransferase [Tamilnaduibacter salinus]|uniref:TIGR04282 family arsenosugar biosynthesis glycosyltransferase n=1 Tax=Tamilnaduibacter salinus TaxID=1484056 RepID=UPI001D17493B|nr:TIGR04282 family arsenosugar biosynthesis glycosyltransferase [Tamilnaduibacter salinus]
MPKPIPISDPANLLLVQFAKWPEKGRVKTRLAAQLGEKGALNAHIQLTMAVLRELVRSGCPVRFLWDRPLTTPPASAAPIEVAIARESVQQGIQQGRDLGARMANALRDGLAEGYGKAIIVGSDCPSVDASYLAQAESALTQSDVVLGPSDDGGFVLIGATRTATGMLDGIEWGTERALAQTIEQLKIVGLSVVTLEPRWDVDELADWERFRRERKL